MSAVEADDADAGARFAAALAVFKNAWAERHPSEPFSVNGVVTPKAMQFVEGYVAGRMGARDDPDQPEPNAARATPDRTPCTKPKGTTFVR